MVAMVSQPATCICGAPFANLSLTSTLIKVIRSAVKMSDTRQVSPNSSLDRQGWKTFS